MRAVKQIPFLDDDGKLPESYLPDAIDDAVDQAETMLDEAQRLWGLIGDTVQSRGGNFLAQNDRPEDGVTYSWAGEHNASESIKRVNGVEVARNLATNPSFEGSLRGFGGNNSRTITDEWADTGTHSLRMTSTYTGGFSGSGYGEWISLPASSESSQGLERGKTYTAYAVVRKEEAFARHTLGVLQAVASGGVSWQDRSPNEPGVHRLRIMFTVPELGDWFYLRVYHWGNEGDPPVWWDSFMLIEGDVESDYFDGDTPDERSGDLWVNDRWEAREWRDGDWARI